MEAIATHFLCEQKAKNKNTKNATPARSTKYPVLNLITFFIPRKRPITWRYCNVFIFAFLQLSFSLLLLLLKH